MKWIKKYFFHYHFFNRIFITYRDIEFIDVHSISFSKENGCSPICADLKVYNPNHFPISIKDIDVEAHLNDKKIGNVVNDKESKTIKTGLDRHPFNLSIRCTTNFNFFIQFSRFSSGKPQHLSLSGSLKAQVFLYKKKIDISYKTDLKDLSF